MALNPFFQQGTQSEQKLVQELINEQLKMYGVEVTYIPRKIVNRDTIFTEVESSKFDDSYTLEAYVNTYEGYGGQGDIMTKFGVSIKDELTLTISKERFEDFIVPFLQTESDSEIEVDTRPREGDLVYFPLGSRLFEVKFVEHEDPFYQLGKNYVYQLKCELFEYEDEVIDTSIEAIDSLVEDEGFITTLNLIGIGATATASAVITPTGQPGYVRKIYMNDDGAGYTSAPIITFEPAPSPSGSTATAVGILTTVGGTTSLKEILITNAGYGYTTIPKMFFSGGGGTGAAATCSIQSTGQGVISITVTGGGAGYSAAPTIVVGEPNVASGTSERAVARTVISSSNIVTAVRLENPGIGYTSAPAVTIAEPPLIAGIGTFQSNEVVHGSTTGSQARVKSWDTVTKKLKVSPIKGTFAEGEIIVGAASSATYTVDTFDTGDIYNPYDQTTEIETEADAILDFTQSNPFGTP